jgi:hypothetical protein
MERPAQRVMTVARSSLGHARGLRRHVESMKCPWIEVKLHGYPRSRQAPRVIQILFEKQIEGADADEGARKTGENICARSSGVGRNTFATGRGSEQTRPAEPVMRRVRTFHEFATADLISEGRVEIIFGRGAFLDNFPLFGHDLSDYDELFDLDRPRLRDHLAFNVGPRTCVGAGLARAEMHDSIQILFDRLPELRLEPDAEPPRFSSLFMRSWRPLHVLFDSDVEKV